MNVIIDHLSAIIVGAVIISALMVLNLRDSEHAVQEAVDYAASRHSASVLNVVGRDLDNLLSAEQATAFLTNYSASFERTTADVEGDTTLTRRATFPSISPPAAGQTELPVQITYRIEPTGGTITVQGTERRLYRLFRGTDFGGGLAETLLSEELIAFDVQHCTPARCFDEGSPSEETTHLQLDIATASESLGEEENVHVARQGNTYRPQNLPANRTNAATVGENGEIAFEDPTAVTAPTPSDPTPTGGSDAPRCTGDTEWDPELERCAN